VCYGELIQTNSVWQDPLQCGSLLVAVFTAADGLFPPSSYHLERHAVYKITTHASAVKTSPAQ